MSASPSGSAESASASTSPSDKNPSGSTTSLTQSIEKLDGAMATGQSNYNAWRFRIIRIRKEKDLLGAIEDPASTDSASKDDQAFTIITLNIKDSQIQYIQDATTKKEAWTAHKEVHQGIGMNGRMVLMQRLWGLRMSEGDDMAQHLNAFRELPNQLRSLSEDGKRMNDTELVTILTLSLPESYEPLVMALQSRSEPITFDTMAGRLLQESGRRQINQFPNTNNGGRETSQSAFTAQRPPMGSTSFRGRGRTTFNGRGRGGFRPRFRESVSNIVPHKRRSMGQQRPNTTKCYHCGKSGHWKKDCFKRKAEEASGTGTRTKEFTFLAEDPQCLPGSNWIIDSGAGQHLARYRTEFCTYRTVSQSWEITIADGTKIQEHGIGDIELTTEVGVIRLTEMWHVPNMAASLISVARMVDAGYAVEFESSICFINNGQAKIEVGYRSGSLYHLIRNTAPSTTESNPANSGNLGLSTNQSSSATLEKWHRRLCHRTLDRSTIQYLASKVCGIDVRPEKGILAKICGICALRRQHKEAETKVREKANELRMVVHTDLCGPMQTPGLHRERYFITFTDEMSGRLSVCLLHSKDGALAAFQAYRARAEKTTGMEVKSLRSDGGGEYMNKTFQKYLANSGIQHIVSLPYTPSQNGIAERMNRTLMENARCILQDSKLDSTFWGFAVLTAAHIHNRLPSRSRNNTSPLAHWTGKEAGIGDLRVFGSTAWVHIPKERRRKLDAKSVQCILVGYEEDAGSKVYRLYNAEKKTVLVSRDVIIDESSSDTVEPETQGQKSTVEWEPKMITEILKIRETPPDDYHSLERITPPPAESEPLANPNIQDTIVVRPRLVIAESEPRGKGVNRRWSGGDQKEIAEEMKCLSGMPTMRYWQMG